MSLDCTESVFFPRSVLLKARLRLKILQDGAFCGDKASGACQFKFKLADKFG